jgi:hypothetical protein
LRIAGIALLIAVAAVIAATIGGGGTPRASRGDTSGRQPGQSVPGIRPWTVTAVIEARLVNTPIALPSSPFAYGITVASTSPTSLWGRLSRIDVATGHIALGPKVPSYSQLFTLGGSLEVLSRASANAQWIIRPVIGHGTSLGGATVLPIPTSASGVVSVSDGPAVGHGVWLSYGNSVFLVNASTGTLMRRENLGANVASISMDPTGRLLYAALDELMAHPTARVATVIDELDARTGRVLAHVGIEFTLGGANLEAVRGGVWVSYRGGMMGTAQLLRASGLAMVQPPSGSARRDETIPTMGAEITMGIWTAQVGSMFWLQASFGTSCVAPSSGAFRAGTAYPTRTETSVSKDQSVKWDGHLFSSGGIAHTKTTLSWDPFASWNGHVYATNGLADSGSASTEVLSVTVPSVCR